MNISSKLDHLHAQLKGNKWFKYFAIFNRFALAAGFIPSGIVKIMGERFTALSANHPMGHYLEALHTTGYYYTFIGIAQVTAAILLIIPRTAILGAMLYFPIILNICILSFAVRFDGSLLSSPLMVLANLYLLCWYYDRLKFVLPFDEATSANAPVIQDVVSNKFPITFFAGVFATVILLGLGINSLFDIRPRNSLSECRAQFVGTNRVKAGNEFCDCIFIKAQPLDKSLKQYREAIKQERK